MTVVQASNGNFDVVSGGALVRGGFATSAEAWRRIDRRAGDPVSPSEKRAQYGFDRSCETPTIGAHRFAPRDNEAWVWPEDLRPLRNHLAGKGVDVGSVKTARQALYFARRLGSLPGQMPKRGEELFPALLAAQRRLCGGGKASGKPAGLKSKGRAPRERRSREPILRQVQDDAGPVLIKRANAAAKLAPVSGGAK